ncbi:unnamed protein product, partial [Schistosoma curassoni]|uniref:Protein kinase domain-containing protein n=1 Tax=Schistosoma curassoni TaxID=6186 RepID=A0A183KZS4_9TREM
VDEDIAKIGVWDTVDTVTHGQNIQQSIIPDESLIARLDMADYKFSFHEKAREYNPAWMSPESLQKKASEINLEASDMWSFGVILWELTTRMIPFDGINPMIIGMKIMKYYSIGKLEDNDNWLWFKITKQQFKKTRTKQNILQKGI